MHIIGYARTKMSQAEYLDRVMQHIKDGDTQELEQFKAITSYQSGLYNDDASWQLLDQVILKSEKSRGADLGQCKRVFYMALPPSVFIPVAQGVRKNVYCKDGVNRIIVEKPFGMDTASSNELSHALNALFSEDEIYRIDHYLGKEMVKNIMTVRFANMVFDHIWDRKSIDNVQITLKEPFGTEGRSSYFDDYGIIRDAIQNHLLQMLSLIAMERPVSAEPDAIRDEKVRVLRCIPPIALKDALLAQYVAADGKPGYREDATFQDRRHSRTPTFAAMTLWIQNERWEGVPFILSAGKALDEARVEIRIQFRNVAGSLYKGLPRNELIIRVQPHEAMYLKFNTKLPGLSYETLQSNLGLSYHTRFTDRTIPDAYESLILDVLRSDQANFVRDDELAAAWHIFTPLLHRIEQDPTVPLATYPFGSRGPADMDAFVARYGYDCAHGSSTLPVQKVAPQSSNEL